MLEINLLDKYNDSNLESRFNDWTNKQKGVCFTNETTSYKVGGIVSFIGGLDRNIIYTTKILGIDKLEQIYVLWDCYWFPIDTKDVTRNLKVLETK